MKKTVVIILSIVLCIILAGAAVAVGGEGKIFNVDDTTSEPTEEKTVSESEQETKVENETSVKEETPQTTISQTQKNSAENKKEAPAVSQYQSSVTETKTSETTTSSAVTESIQDIPLTAEDIALKSEIAKISETKADFRINKNQGFLGKNYKLVYKQINTQFTDKGEEKVDYVGKTNDGYDIKCTYNLKDGTLFTARWDLPKTEKKSDSISMEEAEKLARKYAAEYCDLSVYSLSYTKERTNEYVFVFTKFIENYSTADQVDVEIDFQGNIIYLRNNTGVFDGMEFTVDETKLNSEFERQLNNFSPNRTSHIVNKRYIDVEDGILVMNYNVEVSTQSYTSGVVLQIPIE